MKVTKILLVAGVAGLAALGVARLQRPPAGTPGPAEPTPAPLVQRSGLEPPASSLPSAPAELPAGPRRSAADPARAATTDEQSPPVPPAPVLTRVTALFVDPDGSVVPGVELRAHLETPAAPREVPVARSGGNGRAELLLRADAATDPVFLDWRAEGYCLGGLRARLEPEGPTDLGTITLARGSAVSGHVVDPGGRAVAGARVWAGAAELPAGDRGQMERRGPATLSEDFLEREATPWVSADEDGRFRIPGVQEGRARLWAHAEGMRYGASAPFVAVSGREVQGIEVVLTALATDDRIEGIVLSARGEPVAGIEVFYSLHDDDFGLTSSVRTGDDGRFRVVLWRQVPHAFSVRGGALGDAHAARVDPGTLDLVLRLGREDSYELLVTDPRGAPIETYRVETRLGTERDWSGRFEAGEEHPDGRMRIGRPEGRFWIVVRAAGYALGQLGPFEPEGVPDPLHLVLVPAPGIAGRVYADGAPRSGVRVALYRATDPAQRLEVSGFPAFWQETSEEGRTDETGAFLLMPREAGEFLVRAELEGWTAGESRSVRLPANAGADGLDVHLGHGGTLVVQVVAPPGQDAAGVVVAVTRGDGHPRTHRADAQGRAVFEGLTPGRYEVLATEKELLPIVTVSASQETGTPPPEPRWVVEVLEGRTAGYTLALGER